MVIAKQIEIGNYRRWNLNGILVSEGEGSTM